MYGNADRTAINAAMFTKVLEEHWKQHDQASPDIIAIRASNMVRQLGKKEKRPMQEKDKHYTCENCGDSCLKAGGGFGKTGAGKRASGGHFVDPLLKLCKGIAYAGVQR